MGRQETTHSLERREMSEGDSVTEQYLWVNGPRGSLAIEFNPLKPTVAIWVQL